jgi:hypothetical protein
MRFRGRLYGRANIFQASGIESGKTLVFCLSAKPEFFSTTSFLRERSKVMLKRFLYLVLALGLLVGAQAFVGCDSSGDDGGPPYIPPLYIPGNAVQRTWVNADNPDWFVAITDTSYTEYPSVTLNDTFIGKDNIIPKGTIVDVALADFSQMEGYIYVKVDDDYLSSPPTPEYFAVRWEDYTGNSIKLWSTYANGDVESTLAGAKTNYDENYDANWSQLATFNKVDVLVGSLKGDYDGTGLGTGSIVEITDITYTDSHNVWGVTYSGIIVATTDPSESEGYIYIKYEYAPYGTAGNYYVIHWKNKTASSINLSGASDGTGQPTLEKARSEYTVGNGYFSYYTTFDKQP